MGRCKPCQDHLGNGYPSVTAMCRAYGITKNVYCKRIRKGWTIEKALSPPQPHTRPYKAPDGTEYPSIAAMCRETGIPVPTVVFRITRYGADSELVTAGSAYETTDHLGNTYPNVKAMATAYGIDAKTYRDRIRRGYTKERALTEKPYEAKGNRAADFNGREFRDFKSMCLHWNVKPKTANAHMARYKMEPADALRKTIMLSWPGHTVNGTYIEKCVEWPWFLCLDHDGTPIVRSADAVIDKR